MIQENIDRKGFVYILVNPAFTGFVKVGKTIKEPEIRARELSSGSGVPAPYAVAWDAFVKDCDQVEKLIHQQLAHTRSRNDREFFAIPLKNAISIASSIVAPFSCEQDLPFAGTSITPDEMLTPRPTTMTITRKHRPRMQQEELIEVAEDYPNKYAQEPPNGTSKTISRIEYELLIANPYKFTERELFYKVHVVHRNRPDLKIDSYNIKRSLLVQSFGWGLHRNNEGKLALVAIESDRYKELQESIKRTKSYRKNKA
jgi:Family of unknown function (DUF6157)/T5orf172 domain